MQEAFVELTCPACEETWTDQPHDLPEPKTDFECQHCGDERYLSEFMDSHRDLEILREFHTGAG